MHRNMSTGKKLFNFKNTTFLWTWTLRSLATYASWCNTLPSNKFPKSVKVLVFKELKWSYIMRGPRGTAPQYGGERVPYYIGKWRETWHSFNDFAVLLDPRMVYSLQSVTGIFLVVVITVVRIFVALLLVVLIVVSCLYIGLYARRSIILLVPWMYNWE